MESPSLLWIIHVGWTRIRISWVEAQNWPGSNYSSFECQWDDGMNLESQDVFYWYSSGCCEQAQCMNSDQACWPSVISTANMKVSSCEINFVLKAELLHFPPWSMNTNHVEFIDRIPNWFPLLLCRLRRQENAAWSMPSHLWRWNCTSASFAFEWATRWQSSHLRLKPHSSTEIPSCLKMPPESATSVEVRNLCERFVAHAFIPVMDGFLE